LGFLVPEFDEEATELVGSSNNYSKRSSSRGKSPPIVSAGIPSVASQQGSNANTNVNMISSSALSQTLANNSPSGASQKVASANQSGAVQTNSSTSTIVSAAPTK
jgi:hypothetical protein